MSSGTTENLTGIWGDQPSSVFVVGNKGTIVHYNGSVWNMMNSGTTSDIIGVWGSGSDNVFAVGNEGTILHYDGSLWRTMSSGTRNLLNGVWGSGPNDVFAVGGGGTVLHYSETLTISDHIRNADDTSQAEPPATKTAIPTIPATETPESPPPDDQKSQENEPDPSPDAHTSAPEFPMRIVGLVVALIGFASVGSAITAFLTIRYPPSVKRKIWIGYGGAVLVLLIAAIVLVVIL